VSAVPSDRRPLLVVLTGPTGSGKSDWAIALAEQLPLEIISVDSALVYRGMDIGTAKPPPTVRARVPHHLIDIRDASETYSAGDFVRDARAAIAAIHARGRIPLLVGGTMLYLRALYQGLAALPPASLGVRAQLEARAAEHGWHSLHAQLLRIDPRAGARIHPQDSQRIQRALEVFELTGKPISEWQAQTQGARAEFRWLRAALIPVSRAALQRHLAARFESMLQAGLVEEVRALYTRGDLGEQHASIRAVGYRQLWQYCAGRATLAMATRQAITATSQLAKRQLTWLRGDVDIERLDAEDVEARQRLVVSILQSRSGMTAENTSC